jgi:hypothetical protein
MSTVCPNCGVSTRPGAKFCGVCGTNLPAVQAAAPISAPPAWPMPVKNSPPPTQLFTPAGAAEMVLSDGTRLPLSTLTTIGRDESQCNLAFPHDNRLSRLHARLEEQGGRWQLTDLGSSNGTFVNGQRLAAHSPIFLQPTDQVLAGSTGFSLSLAGQSAMTPAWSPMPAIPAMPGQASLPDPAGGWKVWKKQPAVEGHVRDISERYMVKKDDVWKKGCLAAALGIFISPVLVFLPFMHGNEMAARDMRVEDRSGRMVDVLIVGELVGRIALGDTVAVWGRPQGGVLVMDYAHNYQTDTEIRLKKR